MSVNVVTRPITVQITAPERQIRVSTQTVQIIKAGQVGFPGQQGPVGPSGPSGDGSFPAVRFSYGDATPQQLFLLPAGQTSELVLIALEIEEAFDGVGATIQLGIAGQPGLLMTLDANDPATVGSYETSPRVALPPSTPIILTMSAGAAATQGRGQFVIQATPTT